MNRLKLFLGWTCLLTFLLVGCNQNEQAETFAHSPEQVQGATDEAQETTEPTQATPTPEPVNHHVLMTVTGDLMVHEDMLTEAYNKATDTYDFDHCFADVKKYLENSDVTIGNLETTITADKTYSTYPTFNAPPSYIDAIQHAGFDILTTANNHSNDKGEAGIISTLDALDAHGLSHFGTYRSQEARDTVLIKQINSITFAFLSYTYGTNGLPLTPGKDYLLNIMDMSKIQADIQRAKALHPDFIIVMPHMGNEYESYPQQVFVDWIDGMIEAGADIVLASHPHVLQPMTYRTVTRSDGTQKTALVVYSLGNFLSGQRTLPREAGVIVDLAFDKKGDEQAVLTEASYIPTWVQYRAPSGKFLIRVLPIYDVLMNVKNGVDTGLRPKDIERVKQVHTESNFVIQNKKIPLADIQERYVIPKPA